MNNDDREAILKELNSLGVMWTRQEEGIYVELFVPDQCLEEFKEIAEEWEKNS